MAVPLKAKLKSDIKIESNVTEFYVKIFSDFADSAEKIYTLAGKIKNDLRVYTERKERDRIKLEIEKIRDLVGSIDAMISKLRSDLILMEIRGETEQYQIYVDNFRRLYIIIQRMSDEMLAIAEQKYFNKFPELREKIYLKIGMETTQKEDKDLYWKDYQTFRGFIDHIHHFTREALIALNVHIEAKFGPEI